ncbi:DUF3035 domain-containing protein [Pseudooceanicola sp. CBS1P-1]|uniref:DUF3035 domain-containing protein n=2 Tax=Paracoccaceae TaxID=31989 RepID=A0A6L7G731_9RHOB|nr:DUF3035 domain-containing protein [Pseudooceanicola endophyticus]MXN19749.1 DUF3035 domain-containing protein [Pseudooceanicola albus]
MATGLALATVCALAACGSDRDISMRKFHKTSAGPEEFDVLPTKDLEQPANYTTLPVPTPGGANLVDQTPRADAVTALGGKASALVDAGRVPASDTALVTYASRDGIDPSIRPTLEKEDTAFRRKMSRFGFLNILGIDRYYEAYKDQTLDAQKAAARARAAGIETPTSPPGDGSTPAILLPQDRSVSPEITESGR